MIVTIYLVSRPDPGKSFATYRSGMVRSVQRLYGMDMESNDPAAIRNYLAQHRGHSDFLLPPGLERVRAEGCAVLPWRGKTVSMICFELNNRPELYLFVVNQKDLPDPPGSDQPQFIAIGRFTSASWSAGDKSYVLAARGDESVLRRYVE